MRKRNGHVLATLMFTDIVDSTAHAKELGDRRWRVLLARHHQIVRRAIKRHHGSEVDNAGDGFFAKFDDQVDAILCACRIADEITTLGIEVRAGCHVGQAEVLGRKLGGVTVHAAARVMSQAGAGEVLISNTMKDLVPASGFTFVDRGVHELKGIEGDWHLYAVVAVDGVPRPDPPDPEELARLRGTIKPPPLVERRSGRVVIAGLMILVAIGAAAIIASRPRAIDVQPNSLVRIDPTTDEIVADIPVSTPDGAQIAFVPSSHEVWVLSQRSQVASAVNTSTYRVRAVPLFPGSAPADTHAGWGIAFAYGKVWVTGGDNELEALDPATKRVVHSATIPEGPTVLASGLGHLWMAVASGMVFGIDPPHFEINERLDTGVAAIGIVAGRDAVWVSDPAGGTVVAVDPRSGKGTRVFLGFDLMMPGASGTSSPEIVRAIARPSRIAVAPDGDIWVSDNENGVVYRIDPFTHHFRSFPVGDSDPSLGSGIAWLDGSIWVTSAGSKAIIRVDPATGEVQDRIPVSFPPNGLTVGDGSVWATVNPDPG